MCLRDTLNRDKINGQEQKALGNELPLLGTAHRSYFYHSIC